MSLNGIFYVLKMYNIIHKKCIKMNIVIKSYKLKSCIIYNNIDIDIIIINKKI